MEGRTDFGDKLNIAVKNMVNGGVYGHSSVDSLHPGGPVGLGLRTEVWAEGVDFDVNNSKFSVISGRVRVELSTYNVGFSHFSTLSV